MWPGSNLRNREPSVASRHCCHFLFSGRRVYRYLRSGHRFTGSRAYDTSPGRRRRSTLLCLKRDRDHQSQQQTPAHQSEGLIKGSSYCVFVCAAVFMHENFPRVKAECNPSHEGLTSRLLARGRPSTRSRAPDPCLLASCCASCAAIFPDLLISFL